MADWMTRMGLGHSSTDGTWRVSDKRENLLLRGVGSEVGSSDET